MKSVSLALVLLLTLAGCGGGSSSSSSSNNSGNGGGNSGGGAITPAVVVNVSPNATQAGVNVTVPPPAASTPPNAQVLGVAASLSGASAFNTGAVIHQGATDFVLLFGPGLSSAMTIKISGPPDITISNIVSITAKGDNTPGVAFQASVNSGAALGARTVWLQNAQNDVTTFTGGLEVVP